MREAKDFQESFAILKKALDVQPDQPELLYDVALAAEKLDRLDIVETNLRRLIVLKPDHAQAYNALGYTLADRNQRSRRPRAGPALGIAGRDRPSGAPVHRRGRAGDGLDSAFSLAGTSGS